MIRCDFCGFEFDPTCLAQSCQGCPLSSHCARYNCPRCGYEILPEAKLISWGRSVWKKMQSNKDHSRSYEN